jgi:plasmid stabilization system protein ParE
VKRLTYHPEADEEIDGAFNWYAAQSARAADGFYEELFFAIRRIHRQPGLFSPYLHGTRRAVLDCYPFSVVFRDLPLEIQIVAGAHAKRRPGYWTSRL